MKFADLVHVQHRPADSVPASRTPLEGQEPVQELRGGRNEPFVRSLFDKRRAPHTVSNRRRFLKGTLTAASATAAAAVATIGPAREVFANDGPITVSRADEYGYRILSKCAAGYASHNCTPGCGSTPVCNPHCCTPDGWYRNEPSNGYRLVPGICINGSVQGDGWLWTYQVGVSSLDRPCQHCTTIQFRCHDGAYENPVGSGNWTTSICRHETFCGTDPVPAPVPTAGPIPTPIVVATPVPACTAIGAIEGITDNSGGNLTVTGWVKGRTSGPVFAEVTVDGNPGALVPANVYRPDVQSAVVGAGSHHGFTAELSGLSAGIHNICVGSLESGCQVQVSCLAFSVGTSNPPTPVPTAAPAATATPVPTAVPAATATPVPTAAPAPTAVPAATPTPVGPVPPVGVPKISDSPSVGAVEVLQASRNGSGAFASGWAGDNDTQLPVTIIASVNGVDVVQTTPQLSRPDVLRAFPHMGPTTGWTLNIPTAAGGSYSVCIIAVDPEDGRRYLLGCRVITVSAAGAAQAAAATVRDAAADAQSWGTSSATSRATDWGAAQTATTDAG